MQFALTVAMRFKEICIKQEKKGLQKYGKPVDPLDGYDWLAMAEEEFVDGMKYMFAEREKRNIVLEQSLSKLVTVMENETLSSEAKAELEFVVESLHSLRWGYTIKPEEDTYSPEGKGGLR